MAGKINRWPTLAFLDLRYWYNSAIGIDNKNYATTGTLGAGSTTVTSLDAGSGAITTTGTGTFSGGLIAGASATKMEVEADGDTFWVGAGSGLPYGSFYGNEIANANAVNNSYARIADTDCVTGEVNLVTYTDAGTTLTVSKAGRYLITWSVAGESSAGGGGQHILGGIMIDSTTVLQAAGQSHYEPTAADKQIVLAGTAIISCPNGTEVIGVGVGSAANITITVDHVNLSIAQVGG